MKDDVTPLFSKCRNVGIELLFQFAVELTMGLHATSKQPTCMSYRFLHRAMQPQSRPEKDVAQDHHTDGVQNESEGRGSDGRELHHVIRKHVLGRPLEVLLLPASTARRTGGSQANAGLVKDT